MDTKKVPSTKGSDSKKEKESTTPAATSIIPKKEKKAEKSKEIAKATIEEKATIYHYPAEVKGNLKKEKSFRKGRRDQLQGFVDEFHLKTRIQKDKDWSFPDHFKKFKAFYKGNYQVNDFSVDSLRESINDAQRAELEAFLTACKKHVSDK